MEPGELIYYCIYIGGLILIGYYAYRKTKLKRMLKQMEKEKDKHWYIFIRGLFKKSLSYFLIMVNGICPKFYVRLLSNTLYIVKLEFGIYRN